MVTGEPLYNGLPKRKGVTHFLEKCVSLIVGHYNVNENGLKYSQFLGGVSRDAIVVATGSGLGWVARGQGINMTGSQRLIAAEFGPPTLGLMLNNGKVTTFTVLTDYIIKTGLRIDTVEKLISK